MDQFGATTVVQIRTIIADDLKDTSLDVAIDLSKMTSIDVTGLRFLSNLRKALIKENRLMVFFGGTEEIRELIQNDTDYIICILL
jgi:anti-anti-sigma regulatory factor